MWGRLSLTWRGVLRPCLSGDVQCRSVSTPLKTLTCLIASFLPKNDWYYQSPDRFIVWCLFILSIQQIEQAVEPGLAPGCFVKPQTIARSPVDCPSLSATYALAQISLETSTSRRWCSFARVPSGRGRLARNSGNKPTWLRCNRVREKDWISCFTGMLHRSLVH